MSFHVTIAEVAREAGVSRHTVSRVFRNSPGVGEATRQRVLDVAQRLGYQGPLSEYQPVTQRTLTLGIVVPDITNPFFAEVARGASEAAHLAGYNLLLCHSAEDVAREVAALRALEAKRVDGLLICSSRLPPADLATLIGGQRARVLVNCEVPGNVRRVKVDDAAGASLAVQHLLRTGRRNLAFLAGPSLSHSGRERSRGFAEALQAAGLRVDPVLSVPCAPYLEGGRSAARELLTFRRRVDGIFCFNDLIAAGALQACAAIGRRVPEDVAIIGSDDVPLAALVTPALTTLSVNKPELGATAVRMLLAELAGEAGNEVIIQPELIVRASAPG